MTKQQLCSRLSVPGHLAGDLPEGSTLSNPQTSTLISMWPWARTVGLAAGSQCQAADDTGHEELGYHLISSSSQVTNDGSDLFALLDILDEKDTGEGQRSS